MFESFVGCQLSFVNYFWIFSWVPVSHLVSSTPFCCKIKRDGLLTYLQTYLQTGLKYMFWYRCQNSQIQKKQRPCWSPAVNRGHRTYGFSGGAAYRPSPPSRRELSKNVRPRRNSERSTEKPSSKRCWHLTIRHESTPPNVAGASYYPPGGIPAAGRPLRRLIWTHRKDIFGQPSLFSYTKKRRPRRS